MAYILFQTCETTLEALAFFYRLFWNYQEEGVPYGSIAVFFLYVLIDMAAVTMGIMHFYFVTGLLKTRVDEAACSVFKVRYLNNQIIYNNLSGFMRRKTVCRKADAIQKYSMIQKMEYYHHQGLMPDAEDVKAEVRLEEDTLEGSLLVTFRYVHIPIELKILSKN